MSRLRGTASQIADAHKDMPGLSAISIVGSAADGTADEWSDLDLEVFWDHRSVSTFDPSLCEGAEVRWRELADAGNHAVEIWDTDSGRVELTHYTVAALREMAVAVGERADPRTDYQVQMRLLLDSYPVFGRPLLDRALAPVAEYPRALAETVVALNLHFYPRVMFDVIVARDAAVFARQVVIQTIESTMGILLGINGIYGSPEEATSYERFIKRMRKTPFDLSERLRSLVNDSPAEVAVRREELIEDVFALINEHLPNLDTGPARLIYETS